MSTDDGNIVLSPGEGKTILVACYENRPVFLM